ncbi:MAG TPA: depupylase/deamidase Dop [Actinomycetota bacterium]|nr:depupylase/deamidase Dop [Actinomycetota bacterium]
MAIPKIMGIETEYGITVPNSHDFNPVLASSVLINSYITQELRRVRWDYEEETPLRDARGFETVVPADAITDEDLGLANVILTNGARYYVDHAHPEYSTPECTNPRDLVVHDKAGERILERSMRQAAQSLPAGQRLLVYKNNTDNKGVSYGTHENFLVDRAVPFPRLVRDIMPFFVTRQIFCGAGLLGGQATGDIPYQVSQRADFFEVEVGLETTLKRPIVNTRDEPHADPEKYRRLHVIIGDANMSEVATYLKTGITAIVLMMIEDEAVSEEFALEHPVQALRAISHDISCRETVPLKDGRRVRAVDVQWGYHEMARKYLMHNDAPDWVADVMVRWEHVLTNLERDPMSLDSQIDWVAKFKTLSQYRDKHDLEWDDPKLHMLDLQYHDVRVDKGIANVLMRNGKLERLVTEEEIQRAIDVPPSDTRAYFRGRCLAQFASQVSAASWDSVIFDLGSDTLQRVPMHEPLRGTEAAVKTLMDSCRTAQDLIEKLKG